MPVHLRTCPLCEAMCGLEIHVDDGRVTAIRPDDADVWSKGFICPKGTTLGALHESPDRIRVPMVRDGDTWREVSWPEAFARCEALLGGVLERHGRQAMTCYIGNPTAHNFHLGRYVGLLIGMAQFPTLYSAGTVDQWPKNVACMLMYGHMWVIPTPDIQRTHYWLIMGGNPQASQGSLLACPDALGEIDRIRERGGKTVVIDPRRTGTAERADEWIPIVPGSDAAFLLALCQVLFADGLVRLGRLEPMVNGVDEVRALAADFSPERVEETCRIPAATIRRIAHEIAAAPSAAVYGRIGLCNQEFGTLASWLVDVVNILTGNFDRPGGLMFAKPLSWGLTSLPDPQWANGVEFGRFRSRVRGAPEVLGQFPLSCLAEEIATPGDGQVKALITIAGNPAISAPDAAKLEAALPLLECMISVDNALNETTRHAHVLLPGHSALEQPHFDDLITGWAVRSAGNYSPAIFPTADRPQEWEILARLAALCSGLKLADIDVNAIDDGFFAALCGAKGVDASAVMPLYDHRGPERLLDLQIRTGPFGDRYGENPSGLTLESFRQNPHGIDMGPMVPQLPEILTTPSGKLELAPPHIIADGALARVASQAGSVDVRVEVSDEMMPGVVSLPHGWGHDRPGTRQSIARAHAGVNSNLLAPGELVDPISNNAVVNGIPVTIAPATIGS